MIADAEAHDLAGEYCFSSLSQLLTRMLLLSPGEAAARVRAAAAVGPRVSTDGETDGPVLPHLAAAQRAGQVSTEQVQIVARAMQKLSRPDLDPIRGGGCRAATGQNTPKRWGRKTCDWSQIG